MANYYEMLQVQPTATDKEIETAIDARYNQWRALVTHHDDKVRDQANQAMRMLEQIRATLSDPAKRAVYDEAIGVKGVTAGLIDPTAMLNVPRGVMPPPPPRPPMPNPTIGATGAASAVNAWICPKCSVANAIGTRFCKNCGTALGRECPNCEKTIEAIAKFCPDCGVDVAKATIAKQIADAKKLRIGEERRMLEESNFKWWNLTRQLASQVPATYAVSYLFFVRGAYGNCVQSVLACLSSRPGGYVLKFQTRDSESGTFVAAEGGRNDLYVQVLVETTESVERRILLRFARNSYPVDKPIRLIFPSFENSLRQNVILLNMQSV
ncbi:hypothetical protein FBQ82_07220 [Anaerolineae bacterium CFX7]|nr:hypothetical protein [Anaerolineae bacterium CFX7]